MKLLNSLILASLVFLAACTQSPTTDVRPNNPSPPTPAPTAVRSGDHTAAPPTAMPEAEGEGRTLLTYAALVDGFEVDSPLDESALSIPAGAAPAGHVFAGRLELRGERSAAHVQVLAGESGAGLNRFPEFDFEFVQQDTYLIPVQRGLIISEHPQWNYILEPGRIWQEPGDRGWARASLPFTLVYKGSNSAFNGSLAFLFDGQRVSKVWCQITQEITTSIRANFWGLFDARYHPGVSMDAGQVRAAFAQELANRFPTAPIEQLATDYPGVDLSAFGGGINPEHLSWYGVVANGVNYLSACRTRFGLYPHCEWMRAPSFSIAKSTFPAMAFMRLAQVYGPEVAGLLIKDYVTESAASQGNWEQVTFNHALDMATGNYASRDFMADDNSAKMGEYYATQPYDRRMAAAFDWPNAAEPGRHWVYRTSDTFIVTRAMQNYLQTQVGGEVDLFDFVVDEIYTPIHLGPGALTSLRTADHDWKGQAEGGYGLWWIPDDIARLAEFLNNGGGQIDGEQILHPGLLAASLQRDPEDRGMAIDGRRRYNNAFWATRYGPNQGYACEFWVAQMQGVSGNVVVLMPNGVTYYYFSDSQQFTWDAAVKEADRIMPFCPSS